MVSRIVHEGCFNTSVCERVVLTHGILHSLYPTLHADLLLQSLHDIGLQAASVLEQQGGLTLGELSVDFGIDPEAKPWIIEINGQPQKSLYEELKGLEEVYRKPMEYSGYLLRHTALK